MGDQGDVELVREFFSRWQLEEWPGNTFSVLTEDVVVQAADGVIYVGYDGCAQWYEKTIREHSSHGFVERNFEGLSSGWVLICGDVYGDRRDGDRSVQPGAWLAHVRDGKIAAILYYRTEDDARMALAS